MQKARAESKASGGAPRIADVGADGLQDFFVGLVHFHVSQQAEIVSSAQAAGAAPGRALRLLGDIATRAVPGEAGAAAKASAYYAQSLTLAEELGMRPLSRATTWGWDDCIGRPAIESAPRSTSPRRARC